MPRGRAKPVSRSAAVDLVASYASEYEIAADMLTPILAMIKDGM